VPGRKIRSVPRNPAALTAVQARRPGRAGAGLKRPARNRFLGRGRAAPRTGFRLLCLLALPLGGCAPAAHSERYERFFQCWQFSALPDRTYRVDFEAVAYPRGGVISYNGACPRLRLDMVFNDIPTPPGFYESLEDHSSRIELAGMRGRAIVSIGEQRDPSVLTVVVTRLVSVVILDKDETERLSAAMEAAL